MCGKGFDTSSRVLFLQKGEKKCSAKLGESDRWALSCCAVWTANLEVMNKLAILAASQN